MELKGSKTAIKIKEYFYKHMPKIGWELYSIILNKERIYPHLQTNKKRLYNYIAKELSSNVDLKNGVTREDLYIDKSKTTKEIKDFNGYIEAHLDLAPESILNINHVTSHENPAIQAVGLFCWGIARKYTFQDTAWYDYFKENIEFEKVYLPGNKKNRRPL